MKMSNLLNIGEAARVLGVSPKTLRRWEKKGYLVPKRKSNARLYEPEIIGYWSIMLRLDKKLKQHLVLLSSLRERLNKHNLAKDSKPLEKPKFMSKEEMEGFLKTFATMEEWHHDYRKMLKWAMETPRFMMREWEPGEWS